MLPKESILELMHIVDERRNYWLNALVACPHNHPYARTQIIEKLSALDKLADRLERAYETFDEGAHKKKTCEIYHTIGKLEAVKYYKRMFNVSLKDAKEMVEHWAQIGRWELPDNS